MHFVNSLYNRITNHTSDMHASTKKANEKKQINIIDEVGEEEKLVERNEEYAEQDEEDMPLLMMRAMIQSRV